MFYEDSPYKGNITLDYIKDAESTGTMKLYLNKREKELLIVAREVVEAIRAIDGEDAIGSHYRQLFHDISEDLQHHLKNFNELKWCSLFIGTTKISRVGKVGYGNLFLIKKGQALDIIFVYGFAKNIILIFIIYKDI